jgi:hypothetical protein
MVGQSREELLRRIKILAEWSKFRADNQWIKLHLAPSAERRLREGGFLPAHDPVKAALLAANLRHVYAPEDVIRPILELLQLCTGDSYCCVKDELHSNLESEPTQPWQGAEVDSLTENALVLGEIEKDIHDDGRLGLMISFLAEEAIEFQAQLDMVDPSDLAGFGEAALPTNIGGQVQLIATVEKLLSAFNAENIWKEAKTSADLKVAIKLKCRETLLASGNYKGFDKMPSFFVGADFFDSLIGREADRDNKYASSTLASCAAAVLNLETIEIKDFDKANRKMDNASPLRAHISKSGAAMRLMMWSRPATGNSPIALEFANVGRKHEEEIVYSDPRDAI